MTIKEARKILARFYDGSSSEADINALRHFFSSSANIPDDLKADAVIFSEKYSADATDATDVTDVANAVNATNIVNVADVADAVNNYTTKTLSKFFDASFLAEIDAAVESELAMKSQSAVESELATKSQHAVESEIAVHADKDNVIPVKYKSKRRHMALWAQWTLGAAAAAVAVILITGVIRNDSLSTTQISESETATLTAHTDTIVVPSGHGINAKTHQANIAAVTPNQNPAKANQSITTSRRPKNTASKTAPSAAHSKTKSSPQSADNNIDTYGYTSDPILAQQALDKAHRLLGRSIARTQESIQRTSRITSEVEDNIIDVLSL